MKNVILITTGGTIDADPYPENPAAAPFNAIFSQTASAAAKELSEIISKEHPDIVCNHIAYSAKDSKNITDEDIKKLAVLILQHFKETPDRILITCGTDRICEIAQKIKDYLPDLPCPVIFTGALIPLANGPISDGTNNLEQALFAKPDAKADIYIAIDGFFTDPRLIYKDFQQRKFVLKEA
ncbi:MAG: hypothetical protein AUJ12_08640 [Alphaproteobacteria bacterium CG1_02_46_17]|nr:MAG: hypothetical protein AUJ12_08640 [Alphaproteobacteria bacterium CG1_02_46_17]